MKQPQPSRMAVAVRETVANPPSDLVVSIARICHEVNKAYCEALGDRTQVLWEDAPERQRQSAISAAQLHLDNPNLSPSAGHDAWKKEKLEQGWTYGRVKDEVKKEHPCIVPFSELPPEQRAKDFIFRGVVHAIAREQLRGA